MVERDFAFGGRFGPIERLTVSWTRPITGERLVELLAYITRCFRAGLAAD